MNERGRQIAADLAKIVRGDVFADILHRVAYSSDASIYRIVPECVVAPRQTRDIVAVVKYAATKGIPMAARGAGSGVAGESLCSGIVFDMTRYMNRIISVNNDGTAAVCQPGVVLDDLNNRLAEYGRKIGPDPSSSNRATVGGCVANNAGGAHSLAFGYIADYVESIEAVLADGSVVEFKNDFDPTDTDDDRAASIAKQCLDVLSDSETVIAKAASKAGQNRSGYCIAGIHHTCPERSRGNGKIDLTRLLAGSEGTLAIFTKITLRTVAAPPAKALLQLEFNSLEMMARAVPIIVDSGASACELMDKTLIDMAIENLPQYRDILPVGAAAVLLVEQVGQTQEQVKEKIENTDSAVGAIASGRLIVLESKAQQRLWKLRKDTVPLLYRKKTKKHPVPFIEDVCVANTKLAEYISGIEEIAGKYDIAMSFYGHAGDGELHIRPYLDLGEPAEVKKMQSIANEVFSLAWRLGGAISREHADGLVRAAFIKRQYGDKFYELLCKIKNIFDPDGLMNPGKIINDDTGVMVKNLRAEHKILPERLFEKTDLLFEKDELAAEIEQCYGCGLCRSCDTTLRMCPVFRALGEELGGCRAKANILGFWATGQLERKDFESQEFKKFLDLCINCKACLRECPSGVDISRIIVAARAEYVKRRGMAPTELLLTHNRYLGMLGSAFRPVSNFVTNRAVFKRLLERIAGLDQRRNIPGFECKSFLKVGRKFLASCEPIEKPIDRVAYFVDTYANYNDHELGFAALRILRHNNIEVILPKQLPAPLPAIMYGDVSCARRDLSYNVKHLAEVISAGFKIICSEPSAALCLKQELRHFVANKDAKLVSENTYELMNYLLELFKVGRLKPPVNSVSQEFVYHLPCHLYAIGNGSAGIELLGKLCDANVVDLAAGCCGLAGTFGMQKKNCDLSSKISAGLKEALESSSTKNVLTECSACKMQIEHISGKQVYHPIKVLAQAYGLS